MSGSTTGTQLEIPGVKHKVIGLVSGGKDSTFNLLHCVANGHELVALATLTPEPGVDELDSHLYQSVGTRLLPLIAESMGLPLFTRCIKGKAVSRGPEYGSRTTSGEGSEVQGDETEDLYFLLKQIKEAHPDVTALASGAILSNYQRLRIEHVCSRLGLVSLSFLWQAEQMPLLQQMEACGMDVVLVKVAGVGLGVDLVGRRLRDTMPLLRRLEARYGSHPAGEGGEYETLTLSTPLFSRRLELLDTEVVVTDPEPYPVAYLRVGSGRLVEKEGWTRPTVSDLRAMLGLDAIRPGEEGLDESSRELLRDLKGSSSGSASSRLESNDRSLSPNAPFSAAPGSGAESEEVRFTRRGRWFAASVSGVTRENEDIGEELRRCFTSIKSKLEIDGDGLSLALHASHITLLLPSMSLFAPANAVYSTFFGTSPPSRATVAVPLPHGCRIRLEVVGFDDRPLGAGVAGSSGASVGPVGNRQALHVQGQSYWAPANIGPYSQAVHMDSRIALAGQIPLIPASLTLPAPDYAHHSVLALQHVERIRDVLRSKSSTGGGWIGWVESCTAWWVDDESGEGRGEAVVKAAWQLWAEREGCEGAPVVFVQAAELPKGALVEFQVNLHTGRPCHSEHCGDHDDDDDEELDVEYTSCRGSSSASAPGSYSIGWEMSRTNRTGHGARATIFLDEKDLGTSLVLPEGIRDVLSVKAYYVPSISPASLQSHLCQSGLAEAGITLVLVHAVSSRHASAAVALELFA